MPAPNLGELTSMTQDFTEKMLADNIFQGNAAWEKFRQKERTFDGGENIRQNLIYDDDPTDTTGGSIAMGATINHVTRPVFDAAQFDWAEYYQEIVIWDREIHSNMSDSRIIDLMDARMQWAQLAMRARFSRHLFASAAGTNNILGLLDLFSTTNTYGGISRSAQTWWQPTVHHNSAVARALTLRLMDTMYWAVTDSGIEPDLILTSDETMVKYNSLLTPLQRYQDDALASVGFKNLMFKGIPVVSDKRMYSDSTTRHHLYFLNYDFLFMRPHRDENLVQEEGGWRRMEFGKGSFTRLYWSGNLTCNNCRYQGDLQDIDPAL